MITQEAWDLAGKAKAAETFPEARILTRKAFDELFANCTPTREEFTEFSSGLVALSDTVWQLILHVPKWDSQRFQ